MSTCEPIFCGYTPFTPSEFQVGDIHTVACDEGFTEYTCTLLDKDTLLTEVTIDDSACITVTTTAGLGGDSNQWCFYSGTFGYNFKIRL